MWKLDQETGDWRLSVASALTAEAAHDDPGGSDPGASDPGTDGGGDGSPPSPATPDPAPSDAGTTEFSLAMLEGKTPAELTSDETLAKDPTIGSYKSIDDLLRSHVHAQKMVGNPDAFVKVPTEGSTDEERAAFFEKIGRPEAPEGYKFQDPEGLPEGAPQASEDFVNAFKAKAHEAGVTGQQAQQLYEWFRQTEAGAHTQMAEQREQAAAKAMADLKAEWGAAYGTKLQAAEGVLSELPESLASKLTQTGLNNDPDVVRMLAEVADARGEDVDPRRGEGSGGPMTPGQARAEMNRLKGDEGFTKAWLDKQHPGHNDAVAKMQRLGELAWPEEGANG